MECLKAGTEGRSGRHQGRSCAARKPTGGTSVNTASARIYLKQMNARCEALFVRAAEPLAAMAYEWGKGIPS